MTANIILPDNGQKLPDTSDCAGKSCTDNGAIGAVVASEIAQSLTEEERLTLLIHPKHNPYLDEYTAPPWPAFHLRYGLHYLGEMRPNAVFNHAWRLTDLGLAVRTIIEQEYGK